MKTEYELKPCPFCGGQPFLERSQRTMIRGVQTKVAYVRCRECGARTDRVNLADYGKTSHSSEAERLAVKYWNDRVNE